MKRVKRFVLEAGEGISFAISQKTNGDLIVKACKDVPQIADVSKVADVAKVTEVVKTIDDVTPAAADSPQNYMSPPVPAGYIHVCGEWNNGFMIERIQDSSQFIWIPVGSLDPNGTLDGVEYFSQFGRRNFRHDIFSDKNYREPMTEELTWQTESVEKYGGFYISCHDISKSSAGEPQSIPGVTPWVNVSLDDAKNISASFENSRFVTSHLPYGAEYDSVLIWFLSSKALHFNEIAENSTNLGNYKNTQPGDCRLLATGFSSRWCINRIYDFAGNVCEWTQELANANDGVVRGGCYQVSGKSYPMAVRNPANPLGKYSVVGFRIALYIS